MKKDIFDEKGMLIPLSKRLNIEKTPIVDINTGKVIQSMRENKYAQVFRVLIQPTGAYENKIAEEFEAEGHDWQQVAEDALEPYIIIIYVKTDDFDIAEKKAIKTAKNMWDFPYSSKKEYRVHTIPLDNPPRFRGEIKVLTAYEKRNEWKWLK